MGVTPATAPPTPLPPPHTGPPDCAEMLIAPINQQKTVRILVTESRPFRHETSAQLNESSSSLVDKETR